MRYIYKRRQGEVSRSIHINRVAAMKKLQGALSVLASLASQNQQGNGEKCAAVWHLEKNLSPTSLAAYDQHTDSLLAVNAQLPQLTRAGDVTALVDFLKASCNDPIESIVARICDEKLCGAVSSKAALAAIDLGLRLWIFITPDLSDKRISLVKSVRRSVSRVDADRGLLSVENLSEDFCEESLSKKGGFTIVWTSDLLDHLSFESSTTLRVFHHASALRNFDVEASDER
jgi:hypothetical protein